MFRAVSLLTTTWVLLRHGRPDGEKSTGGGVTVAGLRTLGTIGEAARDIVKTVAESGQDYGQTRTENKGASNAPQELEKRQEDHLPFF